MSQERNICAEYASPGSWGVFCRDQKRLVLVSGCVPMKYSGSIVSLIWLYCASVTETPAATALMGRYCTECVFGARTLRTAEMAPSAPTKISPVAVVPSANST